MINILCKLKVTFNLAMKLIYTIKDFNYYIGKFRILFQKKV